MLAFEIPIETKSITNVRAHWRVKADMAKKQRVATAYRMPKEVKEIGPMVVVSLTRKSPRQLDDDNLRGALKAVRDQVAAALRVDDRSPLVAWEYFQAQAKESSVLVTIRWGAPVGYADNGRTYISRKAFREWYAEASGHKAEPSQQANPLPSGPLAEEKEGGT